MWPPGLIHIRRKDQNDLINIARNNNNNESFTAVEIYDRNGSTGYNKNVNRRKRNINIPRTTKKQKVTTTSIDTNSTSIKLYDEEDDKMYTITSQLRCDINGCNFTCKDKAYLTKHRIKEHPNMKICQGYRNCTSYFKTHAELKKHKVTEHGLIMTYIEKKFYGFV